MTPDRKLVIPVETKQIVCCSYSSLSEEGTKSSFNFLAVFSEKAA
jgi:hypothetical protein